MEIEKGRFNQVASLVDENDVAGRQAERTRAQFRTVFEVTPSNAEENLQKLFNITIQARATTIGKKRYKQLSQEFEPETFLEFETHEDAFYYLLEMDDIGQKIANEFLRQVADVMEVRKEWVDDLHVPLDIHVVKALVKTECISGVESPEDASVADVINTNVEANPYTRISYQEVQRVMRNAAESNGLPRIVFDELWLEHRHYLTNVFLREESFLSDLL